MRRTSLLCRLSSLAVLTALLAGTGCVAHFGNWSGGSSDIFGQSVSEREGVLTVDGTPLKFERWVDVSADLAGGSKLELGTASDAIRVNGVAGTTATLKARLYSEIEGDGKAVIENGRLVARSQGGGKVFINAIEGTVPAGLALDVQSGTGPIEVSALSGEANLYASSGTNTVRLRGCKTGPIKIDSGTGDVRLETVTTTTLGIENGTGDVFVEDTSAASANIESGTGDITLTRCKVTGVTELSSGTGDTSLTGCELTTLKCASGTGDLTLDGGKLDRVEFSSGTGDLTQRNGVVIGSLSAG